VLVQPTYTMRKGRLSSITRTSCRKVGDAGPTLAGGAIGGERNLIVLDAGDVLYDAVRRSPAPVLFRLSLYEWNDEDYDVLADGAVVGCIKANAAPVGSPRSNAHPRL
jgi:hypothetical protein